MITRLITAPAVLPVSVDDAKTRSYVDFDVYDMDIESMIATATSIAEKKMRRKLITQTWKMWIDNWPAGDIILPFGQLQSVTHVKYTDTASVQYTWSSADYLVDIDSDPGRIMLGYGESYPSEELHPKNPIEIQFVCGYGADSAVPDQIKAAILLEVTNMFERRNDYKRSSDALLSPFILWGAPA